MTEPEADRPSPAVSMIEVINHNDFLINDMFNGIPIRFAPKERVDVSVEIAMHCFGYPGELADRGQHMARRYGWAGRNYLAPENDPNAEPLWMTLASKIELRPIFYDLVRRNPNDPIPVDLGSEEDDRPNPPPEGDPTTKVGRRKRAKPRTDRQRVGRATA